MPNEPITPTTPADFSLITKFTLVMVTIAVCAGIYWGYQSYAGTRIGMTLDLLSSPGELSLEDGLVGHWTFDGGDMHWQTSGAQVRDRSGQGNHASLVGSITNRSVVEGAVGQALRFNGVNDYVSIPYNANLQLPDTQGAMAGWINTDTDDLGQNNLRSIIWLRYQTNVANAGGAAMGFHQNSSNPSPSYVRATFRGPIMENIFLTATDFGPVVKDRWYHVVTTWDASLIYLYVNGTLQATTTNTIQFDWDLGNDPPSNIGRYYSSPTSYTDGSLDDIRVYDRTLTPDEVRRLYQLGEGSKMNTDTARGLTLEDGLWAHWTFDGADIDIAADRPILDRSGNDNTMESLVMGTTAPPILQEGRIGQGIYFDGVSSYARSRQLGYNHLVPPYSASFWFMADEIGSRMSLFTGGRAGAGHVHPDITLEADGTIRARQRADEGSTVHIFSTSTIEPDRWYHLGYRAGGDSVDLFVNGAHEATFATSTFRQVVQGCYVIGSHQLSNCANTGSGDYFRGRMDDVRVYNRLLSADEIQLLYQMGEGTKFNTTITPINLQSGLVGHWTFDGPDMQWDNAGAEVRDRSGQGNHGNWLSATPTTGTGAIGQAVYLSKSGNPIDVGQPESLKMGSDDFAVSLWFRDVGTDPSFDRLVSFQTASEDVGWRIHLEGSGLRLAGYLYDSEGNFAIRRASPNEVLAKDGQWHHVVFQRQGSIPLMFVDGVELTHPGYLTGSGTVGSIDNDEARFVIGAFYRPSDGIYPRRFEGYLDDVRVYNRALSPAEILQLYQLGR